MRVDRMSSSEGVLLFEMAEPHIVLVTLNRPEARNAINGDLARAIAAAFVRAPRRT